MKLDATDFELFDVPATFAQDRALLDSRWKQLLREAHPDRVAAQGAVAQRVAMQWSVRINEAYQRLKNPIKRASYLCKLNGVTIDAEHNTAMPSDFLMQQMAWREQLDDTRDAAGLQSLHDEVDDAYRRGLSSLDWLIDEKGDFVQAAAQVRALMFIERFGEDVEARLDRLGQ
jgi:molecular chaperone HscB